MKLSSAGVYTAGFCASALLCACGAPSTPAVAANPLGPFAARASAPDLRPPWVAPDAKKNNLLYVSDAGTSDVYMYSYPGGKLKGTLTGFMRPAGLCVDKTGDVYVTDLNDFKIYEYRHGAKKAMRVLKDPGEDPGDCSVDPTTGNLAVSNVSTPYTGAGDLLVYTHARGKPKKYRDPLMFLYYFCAYDNQGNLYVDGMLKGDFAFAEIPNGQNVFTNITLDKNIRFGGAVQWDGQNVAVGDYDSNVIYEFSIDGNSGTEVSKTPLDGSNVAIGFWLEGSKVVAANDDGGSVMYWSYPGGGDNTKKIGGLKNPWGTTISLAR